MSPVAPLLVALALAGDLTKPRGHTLEELRERYGVEVVVADVGLPHATGRGLVSGADAAAEDARGFALVLGQELGLYPVELVRFVGLDRVVFCSELAIDGVRHAAMSDVTSSTLYVDVTWIRDDVRYQRRLVHHEFFHFFDYADHGWAYADDAWAAFNTPGFRYGEVERNRDALESLWTEEHAGFLSRYGRTRIWEDKAELWSFALVHPRELTARTEVDLVLAAKLERLRATVRARVSRIDDRYWARLMRLERPEPQRLVARDLTQRSEREAPGALDALLLLGLLAAGQPEPWTIALLEQRQRVQIVVAGEPFPVRTSSGVVTGADAPVEARMRWASVLGEELGLYPPRFLHRAGLERIVLCRDLADGDQDAPSLSGLERRTLYLDVLSNADHPDIERRAIHHGLFHFLDASDDGAVRDDAAWAALNPEGFEYDRAVAEPGVLASTGLWSEERLGFLSLAGLRGVEEDKAELWSFALVHPREVAERAEVDPVLAAKLALLRENARIFASDVDDLFWARVERSERPAPRRAER